MTQDNQLILKAKLTQQDLWSLCLGNGSSIQLSYGTISNLIHFNRGKRQLSVSLLFPINPGVTGEKVGKACLIIHPKTRSQLLDSKISITQKPRSSKTHLGGYDGKTIY